MRATVLCLFLLPCTAYSQTIYKCKGSGGRTVYQQMPCADESATIEQRQIKQHTPDSSVSAAPDAQTAMTRNVELTRADEATRRCINAASSNSYGASDRRLAQLEADKARLQQQIRLANNNLAGAAWESGLRSQLGSIEAAISTERASADGLFNQARARCEEDAQRRKAELQSRFEAEDREREARAQEAAEAAPPPKS